MRYVAAYLLLVLGGNESPDAAAIKKLLGSVEAEIDDASLEAVLKELQGKSVEELIASGSSKLATLSSGAAAAPAAAAAAPAAAGRGEAKKEEAKKEEKEESEDMGFDLFG